MSIGDDQFNPTGRAMNFYRVSSRSLWGDYGSILINGMSRHLPRKDNVIQLERTGPFIPPITLPGVLDIVVTSDIKSELEASSFTQLTFAPVVKVRIVEYHWEHWDLTSEKPAEYPETGEPENYILARPHSPSIGRKSGSVSRRFKYSKLARSDFDGGVEGMTALPGHFDLPRQPPGDSHECVNLLHCQTTL